MSRSKKNWDRLIRPDGKYQGDTRPGATPPKNPIYGDIWIDDASLQLHLWNGEAWVPTYGGGGSVPGVKGQKGALGEKGLKGLKGQKGQKGLKGLKGTASNLLNFRGEVPNEAALDTSATDPKIKGDVWMATDTGIFYVYNGVSWVSLGALDSAKGQKGAKGQDGLKGQKGSFVKGEPGQDGVFPEPNNDTFLYGRSVDALDNASWRRSVEWAGDQMAGDLSSPALTTGPDVSNKSILYMDTGADSYNGGPHELEAKEGEATDWDAWIGYQAAEQNSWWSVAHGNGKYVAVSTSGDNRVMSSSDGETWEAHLATENNDWYSVVYGGGKFVAISRNGTNRVMYSTDGEIWTAASAAEQNSWRAIAFGNGKFVAVASDGTNRVMTSPDGEVWTAHSAAEANGWYGLTYGNGLFVAVANSGTNRIMTSPDGENWTARSAPEANSWNAVAYGDGKYVAVSSNGTNRVMASSDGTTWTSYAAAEQNFWLNLTYGSGRFVAVAFGGATSNYVMSSSDGETWEASSGAEPLNWRDIVYADGKFVAVSSSGLNRVMVLETSDFPGGLYFDNQLLLTSSSSETIRNKVNLLANAVVNNAESIASIAPNIFFGLWENTGATPSVGQYKVEPASNDFASVTKLIISRTDSRGVDHTGNNGLNGSPITEFFDVNVGDTISVQNTDNPYALTAKVSSVIYDGTSNLQVDLTDVHAIDDPDGGVSISGSAIIKVQKTIATQGGPIAIWNGDALPTVDPGGGEILGGTLFFNNTSNFLYIRKNGAWQQIN